MENVAQRIVTSNTAAGRQPLLVSAPARTARTPRTLSTPALTAWRHEVASGQRTTVRYDWLWRAACWEQSAIELERDGLKETATRCRQQARAIVRAVAGRTRP